MGGAALFLLPHQDDEYFAAPAIHREVRAGREVRCVFLTEGGAGRARESTRALAHLGVGAPQFLSGVPDGELAQRLGVGWRALRDKGGVEALYCPAWEGGHPDHDAANVLGGALARRWALGAAAWEFSLYQGQHTRGRFFTVMRHLALRPGAVELTWSRSEGLAYALGWRHYPSQWRSWAGLAGPCMVAFAVRRSLWLNPLEIERFQRAPHEGRLLYERYGRRSYAEVARALADFRAALEVGHD